MVPYVYYLYLFRIGLSHQKDRSPLVVVERDCVFALYTRIATTSLQAPRGGALLLRFSPPLVSVSAAILRWFVTKRRLLVPSVLRPVLQRTKGKLRGLGYTVCGYSDRMACVTLSELAVGVFRVCYVVITRMYSFSNFTTGCRSVYTVFSELFYRNVI